MPRHNIYISFTLTMPQAKTITGRWSGHNQLYAVVRTIPGNRTTKAKYAKLLGDHDYDFGDGWVANVAVSEVTRDEALKLKKKSLGFAGYDWMIESLIWYGQIMNEKQRFEHIAAGHKSGDWCKEST